MLLNKGYIGNKAVSRIYLGTNLIYENEPPVGRTFHVGSGSGDLEVDANDTNAEWYPIQANDTFVINPGTYGYILFTNFMLDSGTVKVECGGQVNITGYGLYLSGPNKNLNLDFNNQLTCNGFNHAVVIDENSVGGYENIRVAGVNIEGVGSGNRLLYHPAPLYNNGSGPIASENLIIEDWNISISGSPSIGFGICVGGDFWSQGAYDTRNINPIIRNININSTMECQYPVMLFNCEGGLISKIQIEGVNSGVTGNLHSRLSMIVGQGIIEKVSAKNHMGNAACIWGFYRTGNNPLSIIRNIKSQNSNRYSAVEIQGYAAYNTANGSNTNYEVLGVTADTLDIENYFSGCALDVYDTHGGSVKIRNLTSINGHSNTSGGNNVINNINGITVDAGGTAVYADRAAAGVDSDLIPQTGSPLIGAGVSDPNLLDDYYGDSRPNPPSIGAVEPK